MNSDTFVMKQCSRCKEVKCAGSDFYMLRKKHGELRAHAYCKACSAESRRENLQRRNSPDFSDRRTRSVRISEGKAAPLDRPQFATCAVCKLTMTGEGNFYPVKQHGYARWSAYCKPCTKAKVVAWQKANPERKAASDKKQNQKPLRKAASSARRIKWQKENREVAKLYSKEWRAKNPDKVAEATRRYKEKHPEAYAAAQAKYHAKPERKQYLRDMVKFRRVLRSGGGGQLITNDIWLAICEAFENKCCYCDRDEKLTVEHIQPISRGGLHEIGNLAPACERCNKAKRAKTLEQFAPDRAEDIRRRAMICIAEAA